MAETSPTSGRWAFRPVRPEPRSIAELIQAGTLDTELAATLWLLLEARVPLLVAAAARGVGKSTLVGALLDFVPPDLRIVEVAGTDETFDWLPQASELGWPGTARRQVAGPAVRPDTTVLLVPELSDHSPAYTWGEAARIVVRAASIGYGLAATIHGDSLDDVFDALGSDPVRLDDDELSQVGIVLILREVGGGRRRVVAAHYVRPIVRDVHGHLQRLGPAVLATWDPSGEEFEHFGWGVIPELAIRVGRRAGDFELEAAARRAFLDGLVDHGVTDVAAVRAALGRYRATAAWASADPLAGQPTTSPH